MKVLIATGIYPPEIGGPATYAALLNTELPKRGINTEVLPFREVRKYPKIIRHIAFMLKIIIRGKTADIIFSQDPVSTGLPAVLAGTLLRKKVILRIAGDYAWEQSAQRYGVKDTIDEFQNKRYGLKIEILRKLQAFSVRHAYRVISPSKYFANLVSGWNNDKREVLPIYNGIDLSMQFDKKDKFDQLTIITAGRLVPWKGIDVIIKCLPELSEWRLLIAGDGPDKGRLESLAEDLKVKNQVVFLGQLDRNSLFENIYRSHIFALLSTFESFSYQVVEAMYIGTPVITLDIGNLSEIITNGHDGVLINPNDKDAFVSAVKKIFEDNSLRESLVLNARNRALDFSVKKTIDRFVEVIKSNV